MSLKKSSEYLYEFDLSKLKDETYIRVLCLKVLLATAVLHKLVYTENMKNTERMKHVKSAKDFNTNLLIELGIPITDVHKVVKEHEPFLKTIMKNR